MRKQGMPARGVPRGGGRRTNVVNMRTGKAMTPKQVKARAKIDRIKKSPAAEDMRKGNLNNLKKTVRNIRQERAVRIAKKASPFGPVRSGKVKPTPPKPKGR